MVSLPALARRLRIPAKWLREEAEAGRIPHLKADTALLFDAELVEHVLLERARQTTTGEGARDAD
ncbi:MAG TPA: hypothetical protein VEL76_39490 [Gemmataceae bacterium]|nr:hypothetical protein [Gemmataceae bacterium]